MIPADFEKGKRKMVTIGSVRTNSGGIHGSVYVLFGTNDGKYKIVFDDPKNYKYRKCCRKYSKSISEIKVKGYLYPNTTGYPLP